MAVGRGRGWDLLRFRNHLGSESNHLVPSLSAGRLACLEASSVNQAQGRKWNVGVGGTRNRNSSRVGWGARRKKHSQQRWGRFLCLPTWPQSPFW